MSKKKIISNNKLKKWLLLISVLILVYLAYYFYSYSYSKTSIVSNNSDNMPVKAETIESSQVGLNQALDRGVKTYLGIVKSKLVGNYYTLFLNESDLKIYSTVQLALVKVALLNKDQVFLLGINLGGNQCPIKYVILSINPQNYSLTPAFGSCINITSVIESENSLIIKMPHNNPFLGESIIDQYIYVQKQLKRKIANDFKAQFLGLNANKILQIAAKDGCFQDGVLLEDNSCAFGAKYCLMFKSLKPESKNLNYQLLKSFCSEP